MFHLLDEIKDPMFVLWKSRSKTITTINSCILGYKRYLLNNKFLLEDVRNDKFKCIDRVSRKAYLISKYIKLWKVNVIKRKDPVNEFDLELNEINEQKKDVIIYIDTEARRKYLFSQKDFNQMVKTSLEQSYVYDHLPQPYPIKNPYTNREFSVLDLIELDKMLIDSPLIWKIYRDCKYNLEKFKLLNLTYLTFCCTKNFVDQLENVDIFFYIEDIFLFHNYKTYCVRCITDTSIIRSKRLKNILINWFLSQKQLGTFTPNDFNMLCDIFKANCKKHIRRRNVMTRCFRSGVINIEFTGGPIIGNYIFRGRESNNESMDELLHLFAEKNIR